MRLRLTLEHPPNQVLPINYQYLISSWIYRTLGNANAEYAKQLHDFGYSFGNKKYKLFTFGALNPQFYRIGKKDHTFILVTGPTELELSFHIDEAVQHFVIGLFQDQYFELKSGRFHCAFKVLNIESLSSPFFQSTMQFRTRTPICISQHVETEKYPQYRSPDDEGYAKLFIRNLMRKERALSPVLAGEAYHDLSLDFPYKFKALSEPRSKLIRFKGSNVRGYFYDFEITAPTSLLQIGYESGFGEKNSNYGFGMVEVIK